jgi:hypothetical protein
MDGDAPRPAGVRTQAGRGATFTCDDQELRNSRAAPGVGATVEVNGGCAARDADQMLADGAAADVVDGAPLSVLVIS